MKVKTTRFGILEVGDDKIFIIKDGVLGFPDETKYIILEHDTEGTPFKWLQSVENPGLAFIVLDPCYLVSNYIITCTEDFIEEFGSDKIEDYAVMSIVNVPAKEPIKMTANLRAPIIVHCEKREGRQIILQEDRYSLNHRIFLDKMLTEKMKSEKGELQIKESDGIRKLAAIPASR